MKVKFTLLAGLAAAIFATSRVFAGGEGWETNYENALKQAAASGRPLLMEFTGSDWCPPCKRMKQDIFDTEAFQTFAQENLVLLELDFPRGKAQPEELKKQNEELAGQYQVAGFPTVILLSSTGKELDRVSGFQPGGVDVFLSWVQKSTQ